MLQQRTSFISIFLTTIVLLSAFSLGAAYYLFTQKIVDLSPLEQYNPGKPSILLDDEGHEWARFSLDRREPVPYERLPKSLINAVLAAEDHDFFVHWGISVRGIVRSVVINLLHGRKVQGASTITQQLVKLLFFDGRKTFERKLKEQFYALLVERQCTKEQILEIYFNHVYLGAGIYGVEAASQRFWNISVSELSIDQAAMLAGIIRSPGRYCPLVAPINAQRRRNLVLRLMRDYKFITPQEYEQAHAKPLILQQPVNNDIAPHLKEHLRIELEELVGRKQLYSGGLTIQTTIHRTTQKTAQQVFTEHIHRLKSSTHVNIDGALITMDVRSGEIKALIGGADFAKSKFNRAMQARRQLGSIIKPIIYAAAVERGRSFDEVEIDEPMTIELQNGKHWSPNNSNNAFEGPITLARALSTSNNIVSIKTLLDVGCDNVKALGEKFKIPGLKPYPSMALGCVDVTLNTATAAFNVFANHGVYVAPYYISWIKDGWGKKIYKHQRSQHRVLPAYISDQVAKVLGIVPDRMRAQLQDRWVGSDVIGKTGTISNDFRTNWYTGSTPSLTTGIYIGCDDNSSMGKNIFARRTAFPIFFALHKQVPSPIKHFTYDPLLRELLVSETTGELLADPADRDACTILVPITDQ